MGAEYLRTCPTPYVVSLSVGKYDKWKTFFQSQGGDRLELSLGELEALLEADLPSSARHHQAWWSGKRNHTVWRQFGWKASPDLNAGSLVFTRWATDKAAVPDDDASPVEHTVETRASRQATGPGWLCEDQSRTGCPGEGSL